MRAVQRLFVAALGLVPLFIPAEVAAAPVVARTNATGKVSVLKSLSVIKQADLDFGELVVAGAGTAVVDPVSGAITTTGAVTRIGTTAHPAVFTATGSKNSVVHIRVPTTSITLARVGGGGTITVSNWTLDGSINRKIPPNSAFNFSVGGTVNVAAGQADGTYNGTFSLTVQYP